MASHHKRDRSPYFWISYKDTQGAQRWHNSKITHDREDEAIEMCREIKKQTATAPTLSSLSVAEWATRWFKERGSKIKSMKDDKSRITKHVIPRLGAIELHKVRKSDVQGVFDALRILHNETGKPASGTIKSILAATTTMFNDAVAADLIQVSPVFLTSRTLPAVHKKARLPYTIPELEKIMMARPEIIPDDRRTLYAILFFFGLRFGEGAALTWGDYDDAMQPLACLDVTKAWSASRHEMGRTKKETSRKAPVHPVMYALLEAWREEGFPKLFGREPLPSDLLVPSREGAPRNSNHGMKRLRQDLSRLGLEQLAARTQHAFRTSYISQMRTADVDKDKVRAVTHGKRSSGDVIDAFYTVWPWEVLCEAVLQLPFSKEFLHSIYTAVSSRNERGKWRGGRDSNSCGTRYETLLGALLKGFTAPEPAAERVSVKENFTLLRTYLTRDFTLPEPMGMEEILASLRALNAGPWMATGCTRCGSAVEVLDAGPATCPVCDGVLRLEEASCVVE